MLTCPAAYATPDQTLLEAFATGHPIGCLRLPGRCRRPAALDVQERPGERISLPNWLPEAKTGPWEPIRGLAYPFARRTFAQRFLWAAAMRARASSDMVRLPAPG